MNNPSPEFDFTILILCLNEENSIARCVTDALGFLGGHDIRGEVLVVDNDSTDRSAERAIAAGARVVSERRRGYGNAIIAGVAAARGRFIILGDGDGQHDLSALAPFVEKLQDGADLVVGNRFAEGPPADMSFLHRYIGNPLLSGIGRLFFRAPVSDFHCGLRGFRTAWVRGIGLQCPGMEITSELIVRAMRQNARITEVPVMQLPATDPDRVPHLRTWRDGWRTLRLLLMFSPLWMFLYPGALLLAAGVIIMSMPLVWRVESGVGFGAYTMLFGAAAFVCGAQLVFFALSASVFFENIGFTTGRWLARLQRVSVLEICLLLGIVLALAGLTGSVWSLIIWTQTGEFALEQRLRVAIPSLTLLILGVQVMFNGAFLALLQMRGAVQSPVAPVAKVGAGVSVSANTDAGENP